MKSAGGTAAAAAAVTQPPEPAIKLGLSPFGLASTEGLTTFHYVPESIQQVVLIQDFQKRMADLEQALKREQDRSKLLQSDLTRLRLQHQWTKGGGSGSSGGPTLRHLSPCPLDSLDAATITDVSPSPCATEQLPAQASSGEATAPAATAQQRAEPPCTSPAAPAGGSGHLAQLGASSSDTVVVSRHALKLLYLKERAMDAAKEGIVIADCSQPDMPLIYANEGFTRMTGYGRADVLGRNCRFLQYPPPGTSNASSPETDEAVVHVLHESITAGLPCVVQLMNYKRNGDPFINYLSLNPVHDTSGRLTHFVGVQSDITELVQHQRAELAAKHAALQAAAATEAKSQFLARMSHEIRTPLNGMIAVGQLLADTPLSPEQWDLVNTIRCSGETLLTLITDILDFSRIEANKMVLSCAEYRLQTVIEAAMEIAGLHAAQKRLQVAYSLGQSVPGVVLGDAQRLQQILLNVLNNAVKFTEAGEILLEVWAEEGVAGELLPQQQAPQQDQAQQPQGTQNSGGAGSGVPEAAADGLHTMLLHFSVRDTGIGIGMENIGRLFQSFSQVDTSPTRQHGGSGLGLAICQRLCEAMGGRMWAESGGPGEGSLFQWVIRVKLPDVVPASAKVGSATTPSSRGRCSLGCAARASAGSSACNSSDIGSIGGTPLYDLSGHRVLLVEPCPMVRQVLALALRRWGCFVCAVGSEAEGMARLKLVGSGVSVASSSSGVCGPPQPPSPPTAANCGGSAAYLAAAVGQPTHPTQQAEAKALVGPLHLEASRKLRHLELVHAAQWLDYEFQAHGPYDVIMQDMTHQNLLQALIAIAHPSEAQRVVFMGWPGQNEPEDRVDSSVMGEGSAAGSLASLPPLTYAAFSQSGGLPDMCGSGLAAQPPRMLAERLAQTQAPGQRQLGYVVVTRPVRQGRLRLALEEVLSMQLEPEGEQPAAATGRGKRQPPAGAPVSSPPATPVAGAAADPLSPTALLGLVGSGPCSDDGASSLGSRASSSSNLRCAGATLVRATSSYQHLEAMAAVTAAPLRLLLAEDNAINMKVALGILKRMGCTNVVTAVDGQAALDALHAVGGPGAFDVILMDLHMPKKGGMEAVRDIRRTWSRYSTKIIAVTADAYEDTRDNCIANGFDGWLAKPFRVEEFARVMAACRSGDALTPQRNNV